MSCKLYCDGGMKRTNPGPGFGMFMPVVDGKPLEKTVIPIQGETTNNVAEFIGLLFGLHYLIQKGIEGAEVYMDSQLVVKTVTGEYNIKKPHLKPLHAKAKEMLSKAKATLHWVSNRENLCDPHAY